MFQTFLYISFGGLFICMFWLLRTWNAIQNTKILNMLVEDTDIDVQANYEAIPVHQSTEKQYVFQKIDRQ